VIGVVPDIFMAWRTDRCDRAQLASELAATKQLLAAADLTRSWFPGKK
jgi:hypothetical protein